MKVKRTSILAVTLMIIYVTITLINYTAGIIKLMGNAGIVKSQDGQEEEEKVMYAAGEEEAGGEEDDEEVKDKEEQLDVTGHEEEGDAVIFVAGKKEADNEEDGDEVKDEEKQLDVIDGEEEGGNGKKSEEQQRAHRLPPSLPQRRLCMSKEIRRGSWVPVTLDRPPYIPRKSKCWSTEELQNATSWPYHYWHPFNYTEKQCEFSQWDENLFCNLAKNKTVGFMGDSLSWEQFASLAGLLGRKVGAHDDITFIGDDGIEYSQFGPVLLDVCNNTVRVGYYRNRYLLYPAFFLNETNPDIMIFNRGAHYVDGDNFVNGFSNKKGESGMLPLISLLHDYQENCRKQGRDCLTLWRTTSPGHPFCANFTEPTSNVTEMEELISYDKAKYSGNKDHYMWWEFKKMNNLVLDMFENASTPEFQFDVLPAYDVNILRPDGHVGKEDCLHNCDPGAADVYNTLLLHLMRLYYSD